ncbi:MAG: ABC transporter permease [Oscillibacter sp.]|nr:ABC transporter permease [Oscillibacter sp.]
MKYMAWFLRRLGSLLFTMLAVTFLAFAAFTMISGSPAQAMLGMEATPERVAALEAELGLNRPLPVRYGEWLAGFFTGNLGVSLSYRQEVGQLLGGKAAVTLLLSGISFALIVAASIPLALLSARFAGGPLDGLHTALNQFCMAVPPFFTGIVLSWFFGLTLRLFQPGAFPGLDQFGAAVQYLFFAAVCIAIPRTAMTVRMLRGTILHELEKDYVRTALARGNSLGGVLWRHVLKNALCPTVTFLAQTMAEIVAGGIVVEQVFAIPGLGRMLVVSIANRDYPVVQAIVVILAFWVVLSATVADLVNAWIDPRLRLG